MIALVIILISILIGVIGGMSSALKIIRKNTEIKPLDSTKPMTRVLKDLIKPEIKTKQGGLNEC